MGRKNDKKKRALIHLKNSITGITQDAGAPDFRATSSQIEEIYNRAHNVHSM